MIFIVGDKVSFNNTASKGFGTIVEFEENSDMPINGRMAWIKQENGDIIPIREGHLNKEED